jgi:hypothetical protein
VFRQKYLIELVDGIHLERLYGAARFKNHDFRKKSSKKRAEGYT